MDVVAFYSGSNNTIAHNTISYGNTAGIFLSDGGSGVGETGDVIWDNQISYFRQAGLDIDHCTNCSILTNGIPTYGEGSLIGLANSTGCSVRYNVLQNGGKWLNPGGFQNDYGALELMGDTQQCTDITGNNIHGGLNPYAVFFFDYPPGHEPTGNAVTYNGLSAGSSGCGSGNYTGWNTLNTVSPQNSGSCTP